MTSSWPRCATRPADDQVTEDLTALAARSGRDDLDVTIAVSANRRRHGTFVDFDGSQHDSPALIVLSPEDARLSSTERSTVIAHELAHVLRRRDGLTHFGVTSPMRRRAATKAALSYTVVVVGLVIFIGGLASSDLALLLVSWPVMIGALYMTLAISSGLRRQDESDTDQLMACALGAVFSTEAVKRLTREEGRTARLMPVKMRAHPRPSQRRQTGLEALGRN